MTTQWYSVVDAAKQLSRSAEWVRQQCHKGKAGRFPHAVKEGGYRIPQCCLDGHSAEELAGEPDVQKEIQKLNADTELLRAKKENKMAKLGFDTIADFDKAMEEFEPAKQELAEQRGLIAEARASLQKNEQFKEALKSARDDLLERQELLKVDAESLKAFYARLLAVGQINGTSFPELKLNDDFYDGTVGIGDTLADVPDDSQFENVEEEEEEDEE